MDSLGDLDKETLGIEKFFAYSKKKKNLELFYHFLSFVFIG